MNEGYTQHTVCNREEGTWNTGKEHKELKRVSHLDHSTAHDKTRDRTC
jgi:hypothetical protein